MLEAEYFEALLPMSDSADVVIYGTIESVERGRVVGNEVEGQAQYAVANLRITEVLDGGALGENSGESLQVELLLPDDSAFDALSRSLPGEEGIFFLRNKDEEGNPPGSEPSPYYRWVSSQGVFVDEKGRIATAMYEGMEFPANYRGKPIKEVRQSLREHGKKGP